MNCLSPQANLFAEMLRCGWQKVNRHRERLGRRNRQVALSLRDRTAKFTDDVDWLFLNRLRTTSHEAFGIHVAERQDYFRHAPGTM
ncbi:MAG: hypothetical protein HZA46_08675 [Planctomycetales bacterium]|nr:hypothetical protein [Planctomycetales bacterium]